MSKDTNNAVSDKNSKSTASPSFLKRLASIVATVLTELRRGSGSSTRWIIYAIFLTWLLVQEIIKWNAKLLGG